MTLRERSLDFRDAPKIFAGPRFTFEDERFCVSRAALHHGRAARWANGDLVLDASEAKIDGEECRHIISMRKANAREQARYLQRLGED